jgi:hypothetical protein
MLFYTESGKTTLIFDNLEEVSDNVDIDLKEYMYISHLTVIYLAKSIGT